MQMHNKMEGCFVTAPTTPWAGKELWYKQCGKAEALAGRQKFFLGSLSWEPG